MLRSTSIRHRLPLGETLPTGPSLRMGAALFACGLFLAASPVRAQEDSGSSGSEEAAPDEAAPPAAGFVPFVTDAGAEGTAEAAEEGATDEEKKEETTAEGRQAPASEGRGGDGAAASHPSLPPPMTLEELGAEEGFVPPEDLTGSETEPAPASPSTPEAPAAEGGEGAAAPGRRVVGEAVVSEEHEPIGASALAPATRDNPVDAPSNYRATPGVHGGTGLFFLPVADAGAPGTVRLAVTGEVFFMEDFLILGDRNDREALDFALAWTPKPWLEAYASLAYVSNSNTLSAPRLMQVQGDLAVGAKAVWTASPLFSLAGDLRLTFLPAIGAIGPGALGVEPRLLGRLDFREVARLPLLLHLELGGIVDGSAALPDGARLERVEEFALGIHRYHRFAAGAALESPLPWVTPFVAWRMRAPLGEVELPLVREGDGTVRRLTYGEVVSHVLTVGTKLTALRDLTFDAALDIGLNGAAVQGVPATMPWNLLLSATYVLDPTSRSERVIRTVERTVEVDRPVAPPVGHLVGTVVESGTGTPVGDALITVGGVDGVVASAPETGRFRSYGLPEGEVEVHVSKEGYAPVTVAAVVRPGEETPLEIQLERVVRTGTLEVSVVGGKKKTPLPATIELIGPETKTVTAGPDGKASVELEPGDYVMNVKADGYLTRQKNLRIEEGAQVLADLELARKAKRKLVIVKKDKIELKRQIHFQTGKAEILPDSYQILDQVIDAIANNRIEKVRIEGHTDSRGSAAFNKRLSQARAEAVRAYLVEKGISEERIEAVGYGEERPIAPNLTKRGRAMNRRVEFHILAQ